ncbi:hypothetical protein V1523DRAFT_420037 [Lipomyces doorenjongii]
MPFDPKHHLKSLARGSKEQPFVAAMEDGQLKMPLYSADGRRRTWFKTIDALTVQNSPQSIDDCWLVRSNLPDGYVGVKLSADGSKNKWHLHQLTHILAHPHQWHTVNTRSNRTLFLAHRCSRGKAKHDGLACINPYHTELTTQKTNEDHKGCRYGAAYLCPHQPRCIFTNKHGLIVPCRSSNEPMICTHTPPCY